jgi:NAD(P)-dependent dehydrogenase (short-subunit alcohol dehydrogenase family)
VTSTDSTPFDLTGKVAIVTGASKGIGLAIAHGLGQQGASVVVSSRNEDTIEAAAVQLREAGLAATGVSAHMGDHEQIEALVAAALDKYGGIDVVVNNAATNPVYGPLLETDARAFDKIIDVNVRGPLELAKLAHPHMVRRGGGSVINVSSIDGVSPDSGLGLYSMSKAALINLTKTMALEWGRDGVRVNAIVPGLIKTKFSSALWSDDGRMREFLARVPLGRMGQPEEIAPMAVFLASSASSYCTGAVFAADGGSLI